LARRTYEPTKRPPLRRESGLRDQLERAAVSISNNIAEGFERGTTAELLSFLYIARGSAGEVRSMLCLLEALFEALPEFQILKSQISDLKSLSESIARQLRGWADSLQNSKITGQRYLTDKSRRAEQSRKSREEFLQELKHIRHGDKPPSE
jgi:four helix bundle protein